MITVHPTDNRAMQEVQEREGFQAKILVVDDDLHFRDMLTDKLEHEGYEVGEAGSLEQGLAAVQKGSWDVVLLDVWLPDGNGLKYITSFKDSRSRPEIIIITGEGEVNGAEIAIKSGAWSYIQKSRCTVELDLLLPRTLEYREEKQRVKPAPVALRRESIVGNSGPLNHCLDDLAKAAVSEVNVLITGETGTGKEVFARAIHENSGRAKKEFVVVDCASLPENLIESTLFGHTKGAFTGADREREGLIRRADGGTLFLDEIGELPLGMQKNLLRVLQERRYRPVGGTGEVCSDFRLVAATNRNLEEMERQGLFRKDLLYRLKGMAMHLPPLKERKEDLDLLVPYFTAKICRRYGLESKGFSQDLIHALSAYDWPGNVRELSQIMEHVIAESLDAPTLFSIHLPQSFRVQLAKAAVRGEVKSSEPSPADRDDDEILPWSAFKDTTEKEYTARLMKECGGRVREACRISGLSRSRLYQLMNKHGLS